jgi:hypothetical protein
MDMEEALSSILKRQLKAEEIKWFLFRTG